MPSWRDLAKALTGGDKDPDSDDWSFECPKTDRGGDVEAKHPKTKRHRCMMGREHVGNHHCNCGHSWKGRP